MRMGQGNLGNVREGVQVAGLEGHVSRSAVCLVHKGLDLEGLGLTPRGRSQNASAKRLLLRKRMLSHAEYECPVTGRTTCGGASCLRGQLPSAGLKAFGPSRAGLLPGLTKYTINSLW
jgi:hypothetical protein